MKWYLNRYLSTWREAVNKRYPRRSLSSDGTIGDLRHQHESYSEHNPDRDGSVDAWDMDVNLLGSSNDTGSHDELRDVEALKDEFERQSESQLWIHHGQIANRDIGNWRRRPYHGVNPHMHHVHWQSRQSQEDRRFSGSLNIDPVVDAINQPTRLDAKSAPDWPLAADKSFSAYQSNPPYYHTVERAQARLRERGWRVTVDGRFGPDTERIIRAFQADKGLTVDGKLGPQTWRALWASPVTG